MTEDLNRAVGKEEGKVTFSKCQDAAIAAPALHAAAAAALWALLRDTRHKTPPLHQKAELTRGSTALTPPAALYCRFPVWCSPLLQSSCCLCSQHLGSEYKNLIVPHPADVLQNCPGIYTLFPFRNKSGFNDDSSPAGAAAGWMCCH